MADVKVGVTLEAQDKASQTIASFEKNLSGVQGRLEGMAPTFTKMSLAGTAAFAAISGVVGKALGDFAEAERSQRQLEHAVIDVSKGTKEQVKAISDLSDALQKKSGIDGDALSMGAAQLSTFGLQSKSVVDLTKSLADLTVNQNGVNASGDQYVQSANMIAKAINGQFGVLEKSGIRFTEAQQKMILHGKETEKVAALQQGLAQNLRETTDTLGGADVAMAKLSRQAGEISESIGAALAPALSKVADAVVPVITKISEWAAANPELTSKIIIVAGAVAGLVAVVGAIGLILPTVIAGFALLFSPITLVVGAVIALGVAFTYLWTHSDEVRQKIVEIWSNVKEFLSNNFEAMRMNAEDIWNRIKGFIGDNIQAIKMNLEDAWGSIKQYLQDSLEAMRMSVESIWNAIKAFLDGLWQGIKDAFNSGLETIQTAWQTAWNTIKNVADSVWTGIKGTVTSGFSWIRDTFVKWKLTIADMAKALWDGLGTAATMAWEGVKGIVVNSINFIIGKVNTLIEAINSVARKAASTVGFSAPQIPTVPFLAEGGIVTRPTLAMIGEGSEPEAVIPLSKLGRLGGGGVTVNINGGNYLSEDAAVKMGDFIITRLREQLAV